MNEKKITLFSLTTTYPESLDSTRPKFVHLLNKELVKQGIDVTAISPHIKKSLTNEMMDSVHIRRFRYLPESLEINTTSIPDEIRSRVGFLKIVIMIIVFFFFTFFSCLKNKPDIIHGQWAFPGGHIAYLMSKIFSIKSITTVHYAEIPLLQKFKFLKKIVVHGLNNSFKIIAVSEFTKKKLIELGVKKEKIVVIPSVPNFVAHTYDKEFLQKFRRKFASDDHKLIFFCGRLVEHKGIDYLIKSVPEIRTENVHLILVGGGYKEKKLKELTDSLGLKNRVTFFGIASHEELGWIHHISDIFVCPSIIDSRGNTEGLGMVILEAMESKLPVIATSVGGIPNIITNEFNGLLISQKDPTSIAQAIDNLFSNKELRNKIVENSEITLKDYSPPIIAKQYLDIFKKTKVCLFGSYILVSNEIPSGNTGELLKKILKSQDIEVVECHAPIFRFYQFFTAYAKLIFKHINLQYDAIILPWRSIITFPLIKLIHRKPIIYFPAFSIYDTLVNDRKKFKKNSISARIAHFIDRQACKMADRIVLESSEEIKYFVKEFNLPIDKFRQLHLTADESIFFPQSDFTRQNKFTVLFFGTFIPLHGIDTIVNAANLLKKDKDIEFILCGDGQTKPEVKKIIQEKDIDNVTMPGLVSKKELLEFLKKSDVCLGIFGKSSKANKVVTNKVLQILASKKCLITMDSPAAKEAFLEGGVNSILVPSSPEKLAEAILFIKNNPEKANQISNAGYKTYQEHLSIIQTGKKLMCIINELR